MNMDRITNAAVWAMFIIFCLAFWVVVFLWATQ